MGTAKSKIFIENWIKAIHDSNTKRESLKNQLIQILTNEKEDFATRLYNFNQKRNVLLGDNHQQDSFWKAHPSDENYFWRFINWVFSIFRKNHPQFGSKLYMALKKGVDEPTVVEKNEYKKDLDIKTLDKLYEIRTALSWSRYLQLLKKHLTINPEKTILFLYKKSRDDTSTQEPSSVERQLLAEHFMSMIQSIKDFNLQIFAIERLLALMIQRTDEKVAVQELESDPIYQLLNLTSCSIQEIQNKLGTLYTENFQSSNENSEIPSEVLSNLISSIKHHKGNMPKLIFSFAELAFEHLLLQYLHSKENFSIEGTNLIKSIGYDLLGKSNTLNSDGIALEKDYDALLEPPHGTTAYLPPTFNLQQHPAMQIITNIHLMEFNENFKNDAFFIYKEHNKDKWLLYRIGRYLEKYNQDKKNVIEPKIEIKEEKSLFEKDQEAIEIKLQ